MTPSWRQRSLLGALVKRRALIVFAYAFFKVYELKIRSSASKFHGKQQSAKT